LGGALGLLAGLRITKHPLDAEIRKLLPGLRGRLRIGRERGGH
jgi:hypothetical protein